MNDHHNDQVEMAMYDEARARRTNRQTTMRTLEANQTETFFDVRALTKTVSALQWRLEQEERRTNQLTETVRKLQAIVAAHLEVPHIIYGDTDGKETTDDQAGPSDSEREEVAG